MTDVSFAADEPSTTPTATADPGRGRGWRDRWPSPWAFVLMPLPFGIFLGYMQTPLPYLLRRMGYRVNEIGSTEALILLPMALYFLWSPLVDFWLRRRTWMVLLASLSGVLLGSAIILLAGHRDVATWLLFAGFSVNTMTTACMGGLMAVSQTTAEGKASAAAWAQGGMLGAQALGGALLLYFSKHMSIPALGAVAAALVAAPAAIALTIPEPVAPSGSSQFLETCARMGREIRETLFSWRSLPGLLLLISPVSTGAAQSLFAAMARDYQVGEQGVMLLNGLLGGVLTMLGAFVVVLVPAQWDRRIAYAGAGLLSAGSGIFLAVAPLRPFEYFGGVAFYMLTTGAAYAFFLGVVMDTLGEAGKSASSRYTILVSIGNLPIVYMTRIEGWGYGVFGPRGVPGIDAAGNVLVALCVLAWLLCRTKPSSAAGSA